MTLLILVLLLSSSNLPPGDQAERVRAFTRPVEFDYVSWTLKALGVKWGQQALTASSFLPEDTRPQVVLDYLDLVRRIQRSEADLTDMYADPNIADPRAVSASLRSEIQSMHHQRDLLLPLAESILQNQASQIAAEIGLTFGGQPFPPILFHTTPPPYGLIISPRQVIRQDADISLSPDLNVDQYAALEAKIDHTFNVSSLVVGIGGIGLYPTMVMQTTDINWLAEVVSHEWVHNFLTLRPLGISYLNSPELRTMNETVASIAGKELGREIVARYYPQYLPPPPPETPPGGAASPDSPPAFDYRQEMRQTRVTVDALLGEGKIETAESYMEERRLFFWENGYHIRKINQAYFAFYGAYADEPGGPAGADPVGEAVRALRARSLSLSNFLKHISWMWSYEQLKNAVTSK